MITLFNMLTAYGVEMHIEPVQTTASLIFVRFVKGEYETNTILDLDNGSNSFIPLEEVLCQHLRRFAKSLDKT